MLYGIRNTLPTFRLRAQFPSPAPFLDIVLSSGRNTKGLKESAEAMGIDTKNYVPTETDKKFQREHEYSKDHAKLESGKLRHTYYFKKKKKPN